MTKRWPATPKTASMVPESRRTYTFDTNANASRFMTANNKAGRSAFWETEGPIERVDGKSLLLSVVVFA